MSDERNRKARFATELAKDMSPSGALSRIGVDGGAQHAKTAEDLMLDPEVRELLVSMLSTRPDGDTEAQRRYVLRELLRIADADVADVLDKDGNTLPVRDIPLNARRAIKTIRATGEVVLHDKVKALELIGKYLKMFADKVEIDAGDNLVEQLDRARRRASSRVVVNSAGIVKE